MSSDDNTTESRRYKLPSEGTTNWHEPLNQNFRDIDRDVELRDVEANLSQYDPVANAKFLATDTGRVYLGDGSNWEVLDSPSDTRGPKIVCFEDENGSYAETGEKTYTGDCIFDAAQKAVTAQLEKFDREGSTSDGSGTLPGNIDLFIESGVYELTRGLIIDTGDFSEGIEAVHIRGPENQGAYLLSRDVTTEAVIKLRPESDPTDGGYSNRIRDIAIRNIRFSNADQKVRGESTSGTRDINGLVIQHGSEILLENLKFTQYKQALEISNVYEGRVNNIRVADSGDAASATAAIRVRAMGAGGVSAYNTNHIEFNNLRGGNDCEHRFMKLGDHVEKCVLNYPSPELDCIGWELDGTPNFVVNNASLGGDEAIFLTRGGSLVVNGGLFELGGEFGIFGDGAPSSTQLSNIQLTGNDNADVIVSHDNYLNMTNMEIIGGKRGVVVGDAEHPSYQGSGSPNPFNTVISDTTIRNTAEDGIWMARNYKDPYHWQVSDCAVVDAARTGEGHPITIRSRQTKVANTGVSIHDDAPAGVGIHQGGVDNLILQGNFPAGGSSNLTELTNKPRSSATYRETRGTATVDASASSVTVDHQLSSTPSPAEITVTPLSPLGAASTFYVASITDSTFQIVLDTSPGDPVELGWHAELTGL